MRLSSPDSSLNLSAGVKVNQWPALPQIEQLQVIGLDGSTSASKRTAPQ